VFLNDLLDLPQPLELRSLYDAMDNAARNSGKQEVVSRLLDKVSRAQPTLIAMEDVHWADGLILAHLARLASTVAACPAILIMTSRVENDPLDQTWRSSLRGSPLTTIDLGALREDEALEIGSAFLGAEGNPLFLEQLLRNAEEGAREEIPGSIQSLVQARMDRLKPKDREALQAASVIGQRFALDALRYLLEQPDFECLALMEHNLVGLQDDGFLFAHALIRDGVYMVSMARSSSGVGKTCTFARRNGSASATGCSRPSIWTVPGTQPRRRHISMPPRSWRRAITTSEPWG
jgi:hypothetical protein